MAMGTRRQREKQEDLWIAHRELASAPGHPFYQRLNELLEAEGFDEFVESRCGKFYAARGLPVCVQPCCGFGPRRQRKGCCSNLREFTARHHSLHLKHSRAPCESASVRCELHQYGLDLIRSYGECRLETPQCDRLAVEACIRFFHQVYLYCRGRGFRKRKLRLRCLARPIEHADDETVAVFATLDSSEHDAVILQAHKAVLCAESSRVVRDNRSLQ